MSRERNKAERVLRGFESFFDTEPIGGSDDPAEPERELFRLYGEMRGRVPACRKYLQAEGALVDQSQSIEQFQKLTTCRRTLATPKWSCCLWASRTTFRRV